MKRITLTPLDFQLCWRADSARLGVSAYGRTVAEARSRLFMTSMVEAGNKFIARSFRFALDTCPDRV